MKSEHIFAIACLLVAIALAIFMFLKFQYLGRAGIMIIGGLVLFFGQWAWNCWHDDIDEQDRWLW